MRKRFEHTSVTPHIRVNECMKDYEDDGWELVAVVYTGAIHGHGGTTLYFKRPYSTLQTVQWTGPK